MSFARKALCLPALLLLATPLIADEVIYTEDFESVVLGPNVDEPNPPQNEAWSPDGPEGWTVENDLAAENGVTEWKGWTFADGIWWKLAAGDQDRRLFTDAPDGLAVGIVAVADPDEYDDMNGAAGGGFNTQLLSPPIAVNNAGPESIIVRFSSSWRPEDQQNARKIGRASCRERV